MGEELISVTENYLRLASQGLRPETDIGTKGSTSNRDRGFSWAPFKKIPNCKDVDLELQDYDPHLMIVGLLKRQPTKLTFEPYKNKHLIRYAQYKINRLRKLADLMKDHNSKIPCKARNAY